MKTLALDLGDAWVGTALSDELGITARPYRTIKANELDSFLQTVIPQEQIETIVIGYPITMRGTESAQTKKIVAEKERLETLFPTIQFKLFDDRLSSKQASTIRQATTKEAKIASHSLAAAVVLTTYLMFASQNS